MVPAPVQATEKPAHVVSHAAKRRVHAHRITAPATLPAKGGALSTELAKAEPADAANSEMSAGERLRIQSALLWSGDYTASLGGEDPFRSAVKNFQKRAKSRITGVLSPVERANLLAAAKSYEDEFGWTIVTDPSTGVRLGLPLKFLPQVRDAARGTRWSATHSEVQVETFRVKSSELRLAALFEQEKAQSSNRKIENSALRDDSFLYQRHARAEEILRASLCPRRRNPRLHFAVRPDDGDYCRAGHGGDGQCFRAVSGAQFAVRGPGEIGRIRQRAGGECERSYYH
jgi:hypothetical protein